uniref:Growth-regulating factor n=1 Tax=Davidia involucrata TaxID=16924 RepID=A0A5B6YKB0_DAVIN
MAATLGFPFTSAQWKELERQAMIYKYMMASVPVPDDLLLPITRNLSAESQSSLGSGSSTFNLRFSSNNKDPEPGRCKRTDGKKWRCSRDVAPQQKYCERHMHRGRPRSRKPVEVHAPFNNSNSNNIITTTTTANKKTRLHHHHPLPTTPTPLTNPTFHTNISSPHLLGSTIQPPLLLDKSTDKEHIRGLDWTTEGELVTMDTSEQQWQHLMQTNIGLTTGGSIYNTAGPIFLGQDYREEPLNLISYTDFGSPEANQQNNDRSLFLNPDLVSLEKESQETPRGFIDAWSNDNANTINSNNNNKYESSVSSECKLSPSSLTLSMAMATGNALDEEMGQIQMGLGVTDSDHNYGVGGTCHKRQVSRWLSPVSWVPSTPGGPLAEVLRPSTVATNGDSICTPATTVSSPTGVLQRTMLSLSDSSCCNSPTLAASKTPPEITAFQWLS